MEDSLGGDLGECACRGEAVLILVVVEDSLGDDLHLYIKSFLEDVLILVVVEDSLGGNVCMPLSSQRGRLNPCCCGR